MAIIAKSTIRKGEALVLQILSTGVYADFTADSIPVLMTFPDGSILSIKSTFFLDPNYLAISTIGSKITAYYATNLLTDLQKWGYDTDLTDKFIHISLDDIKSNLSKVSYTTSDLVDIPFSYTKFPDGVYKLWVNGTATGAIDVDYTCRVLTTAVSDAYLSTSANAYLDLKQDETAYKQDVDNLKDLVLKLMIIQYAIRYDFSYGYYTNANVKADALKTIVDTGVFIFKPGH